MTTLLRASENRRRFLLMCLGVAIAPVLGGCPPFASIEQQVANYVSLGLLAFSQILKLVGVVSPQVSLIVTAVQAAFAGITAAVAEYQNAPAADKASLVGKIVTAIQAAEDQLSNFFAALSLSGPIEALVMLLGKIILSTLEGFVQKLSTPSTTARRRPLMLRGQPVTAQFRSQAQFKKEFNAALAMGGRQELELR